MFPTTPSPSTHPALVSIGVLAVALNSSHRTKSLSPDVESVRNARPRTVHGPEPSVTSCTNVVTEAPASSGVPAVVLTNTIRAIAAAAPPPAHEIAATMVDSSTMDANLVRRRRRMFPPRGRSAGGGYGRGVGA